MTSSPRRLLIRRSFLQRMAVIADACTIEEFRASSRVCMAGHVEDRIPFGLWHLLRRAGFDLPRWRRTLCGGGSILHRNHFSFRSFAAARADRLPGLSHGTVSHYRGAAERGSE